MGIKYVQLVLIFLEMARYSTVPPKKDQGLGDKNTEQLKRERCLDAGKEIENKSYKVIPLKQQGRCLQDSSAIHR